MLRDEILNEQGVTFKPKLNDHVNSMIKKKFLQRSSDFQKTRENTQIKANKEKKNIFIAKKVPKVFMIKKITKSPT